MWRYILLWLRPNHHLITDFDRVSYDWQAASCNQRELQLCSSIFRPIEFLPVWIMNNKIKKANFPFLPQHFPPNQRERVQIHAMQYESWISITTTNCSERMSLLCSIQANEWKWKCLVPFGKARSLAIAHKMCASNFNQSTGIKKKKHWNRQASPGDSCPRLRRLCLSG